MNAERIYRAIFWFQCAMVAVELALGLWFVAGPQAATAAALRSLGFQADE